MLQNAYFLAKIGADTAENELHFAEILPIGRLPRKEKSFSKKLGPRASSDPMAQKPQKKLVSDLLSGPREAVRSHIAKFLQNFAIWHYGFAILHTAIWIFSRARSRLYQNEILQENIRLTAFFKLYKICILLHRCNLKISQKIGLKNQ